MTEQHLNVGHQLYVLAKFLLVDVWKVQRMQRNYKIIESTSLFLAKQP